MQKIYFDVCCFNRPFDDQLQERIRLEAEAVLAILARVESSVLRLIGSEIVRYEIAADRNDTRRRQMELFIGMAAVEIQLTAALEIRAEIIAALGFTPLDALHLACAEIAADIFLTTDDRLLKRAVKER